MKLKILAATILFAGSVLPLQAFAQVPMVPVATVVASCGSVTYAAGAERPLTVDVNGNVCLNPSGGVAPGPSGTTVTNDSYSTTTGGTPQTPLALNTARKGCLIVNPALAADQGIATAEAIYANFGGTAGAAGTSIPIMPGSSLSCNPWGTGVIRTAVSVFAATTAHKVIALEFN